MAAGAALVFGAVVAGALGLNQSPSTTPTAAAGEPVGALPSKGAPVAQPAQAAPAPEAPGAESVHQPFVNTAATQGGGPQAAQGRAGEIGVPAAVRQPAAAKAPRANPPAAQPPAAAPAPQQPAPGPVQALSEPVAQTVGGGTLSGVLAPVTSTVDNTLQPALSLIGGLLGH